jgi:hypothetical protein
MQPNARPVPDAMLSSLSACWSIGFGLIAGSKAACNRTEANPFGMRKIDWSAPRDVPGAGGPGLQFGFRNVIFPSWFLSRWGLIPLFQRRGSKFIFPAPVSCLGEQDSPAAGEYLPGPDS